MHTKEQVMKMLKLEKDLKFVDDNLIFLVLSGSHAYGMSTPESDFDYRGICFPPLENFLTLKNFEQKEDKKNDITIYSVVKFFQLAKEVNPNIVELLFVEPEVIVYKHPVMDKILENKHLFLSKRAQYRFSGYAFAQLKKMKNHKKWLENPIIKPDRKEMRLPPIPKMTKDKIRALASLGREEISEFVKEENIDYIFNEVSYFNFKKEYDQYKQWIDNRNPSRAILEEKYGYDTKDASHLSRLLSVGKEIGLTGTMHTKRPDRDLLIDIRNGKYKYEEILEMAKNGEDELVEIYKKSNLPDSVNHKKIDNLLFEVVKDFYNLKI